MKWYETNYCNRRDWLLDNLAILELSTNEALLCLLIDFAHEKNINITYDFLANKLNLETDKVDFLIQNLCAKSYLQIYMQDSNIIFDITPLFDVDISQATAGEYHDLFTLFDKTFRRPLSQNEAGKLSELTKLYEKEKIIDALRIADAYQKLNMSYIEAILTKGDNNE